jgi:hypothetical protein
VGEGSPSVRLPVRRVSLRGAPPVGCRRDGLECSRRLRDGLVRIPRLPGTVWWGRQRHTAPPPCCTGALRVAGRETRSARRAPAESPVARRLHGGCTAVGRRLDGGRRGERAAWNLGAGAGTRCGCGVLACVEPLCWTRCGCSARDDSDEAERRAGRTWHVTCSDACLGACGDDGAANRRLFISAIMGTSLRDQF